MHQRHIHNSDLRAMSSSTLYAHTHTRSLSLHMIPTYQCRKYPYTSTCLDYVLSLFPTYFSIHPSAGEMAREHTSVSYRVRARVLDLPFRLLQS